MAAESLDAKAAAPGVLKNLSKASLDGARMVILDAEPSICVRPGTPWTAVASVERESVEPSRSVREVLDVAEVLELVAF